MALTAGENKEKLRSTGLIIYAEVVELVDTTDLKSVEHLNARAGSIPAPGTTLNLR